MGAVCGRGAVSAGRSDSGALARVALGLVICGGSWLWGSRARARTGTTTAGRGQYWIGSNSDRLFHWISMRVCRLVYMYPDSICILWFVVCGLSCPCGHLACCAIISICSPLNGLLDVQKYSHFRLSDGRHRTSCTSRQDYRYTGTTFGLPANSTACTGLGPQTCKFQVFGTITGQS